MDLRDETKCQECRTEPVDVRPDGTPKTRCAGCAAKRAAKARKARKAARAVGLCTYPGCKKKGARKGGTRLSACREHLDYYAAANAAYAARRAIEE